MNNIWQVAPAAPVDLANRLAPISPLLVSLLYNRGFQSEATIKAFLNEELDDSLVYDLSVDSSLRFYNPFLFRDMEAVVDLIVSHIKQANKIIIYGDYDADGVTSASVLVEGLRTLHADVDVYLPDRVSEGYGLNKEAIKSLKEQGVQLIITVDCGIRNKEEVDYAKSIGIDIIITDHHVLPDSLAELPDCLCIDPADRNDNYPWPYLAGVGVAFKLLSALLIKSKLVVEQKQLIARRALDLVAVGTISDLVNLLGENRLLVKKGLEVLNDNNRPGLKALFKIARIALDKPLEAWNVGWQLGPRLNAASRVGHANSAFALVNTRDEKEARELALELNNRNLSRQQITEDIIKEVESNIDPNNLPLIIIGIAQEGQFWNEGVVGLVAGRICEKYHRPSLIITRIIEGDRTEMESGEMITEKISFKGSGRSLEGFNLIEAITESSSHLEKYGGHPMACGFSISNEENLLAFKEQLFKIAEEALTEEILRPKLKIDAKLDFINLNINLVEELNSLAPYGQNNPQPRFTSKYLVVEDIVLMGAEKQHLKLRLRDLHNSGSDSFWAVDFNCISKYEGLKIGDIVDLAYYLDINNFAGRRAIQLKAIDWHFSKMNNI